MQPKLFPNIKPYNQDYLHVSNLHKIYYEEAGNKNGIPAVILHGGPGAGISPIYRRFFDPEYYRIVLFDQRGAGRSTPRGEIIDNTTWDLVEDIEKLRKKLDIKKWVIFGGSWGSTLALTYAIIYPQLVMAMILRGVYLCRKLELEWYYQGGAAYFYPDRWEKFIRIIPYRERDNLIKAYHHRLINGSEEIALRYAKNWCEWEAATINLVPSPKLIKEFTDDNFALTFAKIETHYFVNNVFFNSDNYILNNCRRIKNIRSKIVHGRYDMPCPLRNAWELTKKLKNCDLMIVDNSGHSSYEKGIQRSLIKASEEIKFELDK